MDSAYDDITRELFTQLRKGGGKDKDENFDCLICPKCSDRLEPLLLDIECDPIDKQEYQTIWWTCRGLRTKTCIFPLNIPKQVFWTRRTMQQMREGLLPLPNIHLLPEYLHYMYPKVFNNKTNNAVSQFNIISKNSAFVNRKALTTSKKKPISNDKVEIARTPSPPRHDYVDFDAPSDSQPENVPVPYKFNEPVQQNQQNGEINKEQIRYNEVDSRRTVELFSDPNAALSSNLSLQYCTDVFLSTISSEMCRKQLIKPHVAIGQKQRLRFANQVNKCEIDGIIHVQKEPVNKESKKPSKQNGRYVSNAKKKTWKHADLLTGFGKVMRTLEDEKNNKDLLLRLGMDGQPESGESDAPLTYTTLRNVVIPGEPCQEHQNGVENAENVNVNGTAVANRGEPEEVSLFLAESIAASPTLAVSSRDTSTICEATSSKRSYLVEDICHDNGSFIASCVSMSECSSVGGGATLTDQGSRKSSRKRKKRKTTAEVPYVFDDPEINNLVSRKYKEVLQNVSRDMKDIKKRRQAEHAATMSQNCDYSFSSFSSQPQMSTNLIADTSQDTYHSQNDLSHDLQQSFQFVDEHGFSISFDESSHMRAALESSLIENSGFGDFDALNYDDPSYGLEHF